MRQDEAIYPGAQVCSFSGRRQVFGSVVNAQVRVGSDVALQIYLLVVYIEGKPAIGIDPISSDARWNPSFIQSNAVIASLVRVRSESRGLWRPSTLVKPL